MSQQSNNSPVFLDRPQIILYLYERGNSVKWNCMWVLDVEENGGVEVHIQTSINLKLDISAASDALPGHLTPRERARKAHSIIG